MTTKANFKKTILTAISLSLAVGILSSCKDDDDDKNLIKERTVSLDSKQEIPTVRERNEKGTTSLRLYGDSSLVFNIVVTNLDGTDQLTIAHIHSGSPVESGPPVITLVDNSTVKFQGSAATGTIKLNASQYDIVNNGGNFYVNVHSTKLPLGLVRGELDKEITFAQNIDLTPTTSTLRPETGTAFLRMSKDSTLHYKITVNNLTPGDILTAAQINVGAAGISGPVVYLSTPPLLNTIPQRA